LRYSVLNLPPVSDTELNYSSKLVPILRHPIYAWLGLRPVIAQHTAAEHAALKRWAAGRANLVEIGVAEGVSALALREAMAENATLHLIDPFYLSRARQLNFTRRSAHRAVASCSRGKAVWIEKFSFDAVRDWSAPIDLLMIDGDHSETGVQKDWDGWSRFVVPGGVVIFHDACLFDGGWTTPEYGPVKLVNRLFRDGRAKGWEIVEEVHSLLVVRRTAP
jgi:predicted O-methyltransferase YrrM